MTMTTLVRAELDKIRSLRSSWIVASISLTAGVGISVLILATTRRLGHAPASIADTALPYTAIVIALLCAYGVASEYQYGTIVTTYISEPRRARVMTAKALAAIGVGLTVGALTGVIALSMAAVWLHARHVPWPLSGGRLAETGAGVLAMCAAFGVAGVGLGAVVRRVAFVTASVLGLYTGIDPILSANLTAWRRYGIGAAQQAATDPAGPHPYGWAAAMTATVAIAAVIWLTGQAVATRADV
jgi:ABC-2 type transport system permease protein